MRRNELLHINDFYNQLYCGCEFSLASSNAMNKETDHREKNKEEKQNWIIKAQNGHGHSCHNLEYLSLPQSMYT